MARTPEIFAAAEFFSLHRSPVWHGRDVPPGDGRRVLLIPGLFGSDLYLRTMHDWLHRIGYRSIYSSLMLNAGCARRMVDQIETRAVLPSTGREQPYAIIGHSRGGMLAKALTDRLGERVDRMIVVGSPLGGVLRGGLDAMQAMNTDQPEPGFARPAVVRAGQRATRMLDPDCDAPTCGCAYMAQLLAPLPGHVKVTSIYSTSDGVVPPQMSPVDGAHNVEVSGSHSGLMFNPAVYRAIGAALA